MYVTEEQELPSTVDDIAAWMATASPAAIEAQAGWWLRSLAEVNHEASQIEGRRDAELAMVQVFYGRTLAPLRERADTLTRCLEALAERMPMPKGRKSVALAWGTIGRRTTPARASVIDKDAALAWARGVGCVRVTEAVDVKAAAPTVLALVAETGEVPDGWEYVAERETPYATPNSAVAAGVL